MCVCVLGAGGGVRAHACVPVTVVSFCLHGWLSKCEIKVCVSFHHVEFVFVVVLLQLGVC